MRLKYAVPPETSKNWDAQLCTYCEVCVAQCNSMASRIGADLLGWLIIIIFYSDRSHASRYDLMGSLHIHSGRLAN